MTLDDKIALLPKKIAVEWTEHEATLELSRSTDIRYTVWYYYWTYETEIRKFLFWEYEYESTRPSKLVYKQIHSYESIEKAVDLMLKELNLL